MIGVAASNMDLQIAGEFFELFKTAWEPAVPSRRYSVVLSTDGRISDLDAEVFLIYRSGEDAVDRAAGIALEPLTGPVDVEWDGSALPIYGSATTFGTAAAGALIALRGQALDYRPGTSVGTIRRIGYDLFQEIRHLLTAGQPASKASIPTLERHIALLRHLLVESKVPFVEILPRPDGSDFICCLTHDVDFFGIRRHRFDRTLAGFVLRASVGTLADLIRGKRPLSEAVRNWIALLSLPLVFLGLLPDFWRPLDDYAAVEDGRRSTFFMVPFKGRPGIALNGAIEPTRAVPYEASEVQQEIRAAVRRGSEIATHGIDAWRDADAGRQERNQLTSVTGGQTGGVRMHWLYYDAESPKQLEAAGFDYDSTWGYNDAVGYRAGTSQVFRLPATESLMELPLSVMDSALFYRGRMGLTNADAFQLCVSIVANARTFGGTLVINWHDRSLAPERLWGSFYRRLVDEVSTGNRVWFATAREAVDWFQWRRSIRFSSDTGTRMVTVTAAPRGEKVPAAALRIFNPAQASADPTEDLRFDGHEPVRVQL